MNAVSWDSHTIIKFPTITQAMTSFSDFNKAKRKALEVLEENFICKPPVNTVTLAKFYGLNVRFMKFKPEYSHVAGFIDIKEQAIAVNDDDSAVRKNFTVAHELGHFLLKHHKLAEYTYLLRNPSEKNKTPLEQEANCFAANLLVPTLMLREYLEKYPYASDEEFAGIFGVSREVLRYRKFYLD